MLGYKIYKLRKRGFSSSSKSLTDKRNL